MQLNSAIGEVVSPMLLKAFLVGVGILFSSLLPVQSHDLSLDPTFQESIEELERVAENPRLILYVSQAGNGMGGMTWETAVPTIQDAIDIAQPGDHIWIRQGEYRETIRLRTHIALLGGFSGIETPEDLSTRNTKAHPTIIDASGVSEPVITGATYCILGGLTLTGGKTGLYCKDVVMKVTGCVIVGNENRESALSYSYTDTSPLIAIAQGGGIHCLNSALWVSNTQVLSNLCRANIAGGYQLGIRICLAEGGGLYSEDSDVQMEDCDIDGNRVQSEVSSIYYRFQGNGAGIAGRGSSRFQINRCRIENHSNDTHQSRLKVGNLRGGGCYFGDQSLATIDRTSVRGNKILTKSPYHSSFLGGGVAVEGSAKVKISNSLVADNEIFLDPLSLRDIVNEDLFRGGAFFLGGAARVYLENCTVAGNDVPEVDGEGAGMFFGGESLSITNSIVWNGTSSIVQSGSGELSASFSIIDGTLGGEGVIHADPLFESPSQGDYRLTPNSPAIDSGTASRSAFDLEGATREIDIPNVGADLPGNVVDMGALEHLLEGNLPLTPTWTPSPTFTQTHTPTPTSTPTPGFRSWYVSSSVPISGDGESWDSPFRTVGEAVVRSVSGDTIFISEGIYPEKIVLNAGVDLYGGYESLSVGGGEYPERNSKIHQTVLTGMDVFGPVVTGASDCRLDGLHIVRGLAQYGAGLVCHDAKMAIHDCVFYQNSARQIDEDGDSVGRESSGGGAIFCTHSDLRIFETEFIGNTATASVRGSYNVNRATALGGAILLDETSTIRCERTLFRNNTTLAFAEYGHWSNYARAEGGAIRHEGKGVIQLDNSMFFGNVAVAGAYTLWSNPIVFGEEIILNHCSFFGNQWKNYYYLPTAPSGVRAATATISNSILWDATYSLDADAVHLFTSNIDGYPESENNLRVDPSFMAPENGDLRLRLDSPCLDAGAESGLTVDLLGEGRPRDHPGIGEDGLGAGFDLGAYEVPLVGYPTWTPSPTRTLTPYPTPTLTARYDEYPNRFIDARDLTLLLDQLRGSKVEDPVFDLFDFSTDWMTSLSE